MTTTTAIRAAGGAAVLGGAARIVAAFVPAAPGSAALEVLYTGIDMLVLLGLIGWYARHTAALGLAGLLAFALAVCALSLIGGPDADPFGFTTYQVGAAILAVALALLGVVATIKRAGARWAPLLWIAAPIAGSVGTAWSFTIAGLLFGAGFVAAGADLVRRPSA